MKSLHTYQEEVKARFEDKRILGRIVMDVADLKDATTQAYLLGLKRGLEFVPEENADLTYLSPDVKEFASQVRAALTQEIDKLTQ